MPPLQHRMYDAALRLPIHTDACTLPERRDNATPLLYTDARE